MTRCSKCDSPHDRAGQRYCRKCHANYQRGWRKAHPNHKRLTDEEMAGALSAKGWMAIHPNVARETT